jgi:NADH-quinone oxidoreductase subunit C
MWEEYTDHPMRRDYVEPDDFEYEPTAHDYVLKRAEAHKNREQGIATPASKDRSPGSPAGIREQGPTTA